MDDELCVAVLRAVCCAACAACVPCAEAEAEDVPEKEKLVACPNLEDSASRRTCNGTQGLRRLARGSLLVDWKPQCSEMVCPSAPSNPLHHRTSSHFPPPTPPTPPTFTHANDQCSNTLVHAVHLVLVGERCTGQRALWALGPQWHVRRPILKLINHPHAHARTNLHPRTWLNPFIKWHVILGRLSANPQNDSVQLF